VSGLGSRVEMEREGEGINERSSCIMIVSEVRRGQVYICTPVYPVSEQPGHKADVC